MPEQISNSKSADLIGFSQKIEFTKAQVESEFASEREFAIGLVQNRYSSAKAEPFDVNVYFDHKLGDLNDPLSLEDTAKKYEIEEKEVAQITNRVRRTIHYGSIMSVDFREGMISSLRKMSDLKEKYETLVGRE